MRHKSGLVMGLVSAVLWLPAAADGQSKRVSDLGVGKLLVAPRESPDPTFSKAVILLVNFDEDGVVGLVVNHRTKVPISEALNQIKGAGQHSEPIYVGGPVDLSTVLGLLRTTAKPQDAHRVFSDVYLVSTKSLLENTLSGRTGPDRFHAYAGYCGWGPGQLQREMNLGVWYIFEGDTNSVFDSDPGSVWPRLIARTQQTIVERNPGRKAYLSFGAASPSGAGAACAAIIFSSCCNCPRTSSASLAVPANFR